MTRAELLSRVTSLCASDPFNFTQAQSPFSFELQPSGQIDQVFRIDVKQEAVIGGLNFSEDRVDIFDIFLARKQFQSPNDARLLLVADMSSLTAAIARDGVSVSGAYNLVDGGAAEVQPEDGAEYVVARLALPLNYESTL